MSCAFLISYTHPCSQVLDVTIERGSGNQRDRFFQQLYTVKIVPLKSFCDGDTFASLFGDAFSECQKLSPAELLERARMTKWFRKGNSLAQDVPFPKNVDGEALPHGAVLNFDKKPIILHTRRALIWWLRLRNVNIPGSYPMHSFQSDCGGEEPGLVDLVQRTLDSNAACMTVEQAGNPNSPPSPKRLSYRKPYPCPI